MLVQDRYRTCNRWVVTVLTLSWNMWGWRAEVFDKPIKNKLNCGRLTNRNFFVKFNYVVLALLSFSTFLSSTLWFYGFFKWKEKVQLPIWVGELKNLNQLLIYCRFEFFVVIHERICVILQILVFSENTKSKNSKNVPPYWPDPLQF